jgi:hypothetical protein
MVELTAEKTVTPDDLKELLGYNPSTGELWWMDRPLRFFSDTGGRYTAQRSKTIFQSLYAGKPALTAKNPKGYLRGNLFGKGIMAHRAAFCLMTGRWPQNQIDHVNGVRDDNRWCNLREATNRQNQYNQRSAHKSSSRFVGVAWCKRSGRWTAYICPDGTKVPLGNFSSEEDAARMRDVAARQMFGSYAKLNFPEGVVHG